MKETTLVLFASTNFRIKSENWYLSQVLLSFLQVGNDVESSEYIEYESAVTVVKPRSCSHSVPTNNC